MLTNFGYLFIFSGKQRKIIVTLSRFTLDFHICLVPASSIDGSDLFTISMSHTKYDPYPFHFTKHWFMNHKALVSKEESTELVLLTKGARLLYIFHSLRHQSFTF